MKKLMIHRKVEGKRGRGKYPICCIDLVKDITSLSDVEIIKTADDRDTWRPIMSLIYKEVTTFDDEQRL